MSYIIATEISLVQECKETASEILKETMKDLGMLYFNPIDPTPNIEFPNYKTFRVSDETYDFIQNVAKITHEKFGEKVYIINDLKFTIWTEEDYEKQFGKLE